MIINKINEFRIIDWDIGELDKLNNNCDNFNKIICKFFIIIELYYVNRVLSLSSESVVFGS